MRTRGWLVSGLLAIAALLLAGRAITGVIVEHEWFQAMQLERLWWEKATATVMLQGGLALLGTLFAFANFTAVRSTILAVAVPQRVGNIELTAMIPGQRLVWITALFAALVGIALAVPFDDWTTVSMARHGIPFGEIEGYHDRDLGFYVYWLPLEETIYLWALIAIVVMTALVMVLYALTRSLRMDGRRIVASSHVRRHMSALGALVLLLLAWSYRLDSFDLLRNGSGLEGEFMRVDHVVTLRVDVALAVLASVAALLLLRTGWLGQTRAALVTIGAMLVLAAGLRHGLPALLETGSTLGDPARRDADYLATRALVSRRAFDVDGVKFVGLDTSSTIDTRIPVELLGSRVSLWDVASAYRSGGETDAGAALGSIAPSFVQTERGTVGMLSVRAGAGERWKVHVRDLADDLPIAREVDWNASTDSTEDASSASGEPLVAPGLTGHTVVFTRATTIPGARLESLLSRVAHAWNARDPSLLQMDDANVPGVFVPYRDVRERVRQLAPVFAQASEVLPLLHENTLYWSVELYSASTDYPLSQHWMLAGEERSYFWHAGTALVDAVSGRVRIVLSARPDPIVRTWLALAPTLFVTMSDLSPGLVTLLPPVTDGAIAQMRTLARHGSRFEGHIIRYFPDSVLAFDRLSPALVQSGSTTVSAWTVPVLDLGDLFGGVATAVGGSARATYWDTTAVPRQSWVTATERLRSALDSARTRLPQGSRREPRVRFGRVHAVMTPSGPLLTQAVHLSSSDGSMPIVQVVAAIGDRVSTGSDLYEASSRLTGEVIVPPAPVSGIPLSDNREAMTVRLYEAMRDALKRADWVRFGATFDSLGRVLGRPPQ